MTKYQQQLLVRQDQKSQDRQNQEELHKDKAHLQEQTDVADFSEGSHDWV